MVNSDLLEWFEDDEREQCPACGKQALVGLAGVPLFRVCLTCAAIWVGGERIEPERRAPATASS